MVQPMDEAFDFVVVGSGGGSMCAGLVMRKAGRSVLILEKTDLVGGSTAKAGGVLWVPNNRFMKADGVEDSHEKASAYLDAVVGDHDDTPGASRERRDAYLREAPEMIDFLVGQGLRMRRVKYWPDYYDDRAGGSEPGRTVVAELFDLNKLGPWKNKVRENIMPLPAPLDELMELPLMKVSWQSKFLTLKTALRVAFDTLMGRKMATAGRALQGGMLHAALKAGVELRLESPVNDLIVDDGVVTGVVTLKDGKPWRVGARNGVLLNAGGFAHDQAMRDTYIPHTNSAWSYAAPGDTGDMHKILMKMGAQMAQMEEMVGLQMLLPPNEQPASVQMELAMPHAFLVDQTGERYMNECGSYMGFCKGMLERHKTVPAVPSWMIMDRQYLRTYMLAAKMPGEALRRSWLQEGFLHSADTIEGLATSIGADPVKLKAATERFNGFARQGRDDDFGRGNRAYDRFLGDHTHKPSETLGTVEEGPFYAAAVYPGDVGTFGGVVTDTYARVLMQDGSVLPGLYATGTTTAGVFGRAYPGAGGSIGPSFTWGYVAAKHAAGVGNLPA